MFDLRYHVASLAAVFLALIIGILVGVGISDRGLVDKTEKALLKARIDDLQSRLRLQDSETADVVRRERAAESFIVDAYPALMSDRLRDKRIAVVFIGSVDGRVRTGVERALGDAGDPAAARVRALKIPIEPKALDARLAKRPALSSYAGHARLSDLGRRLAQDFVKGGASPLWDALAVQLVEQRNGSQERPADGVVVVVRSAESRQEATARFLEGFYSGLGSTRAPVVGVEASDTQRSAMSVYRQKGISTVDDVETPAGRLALALLLAGAEPGHYGTKSTARDGLLPPIEPLPAEGKGG